MTRIEIREEEIGIEEEELSCGGPTGYYHITTKLTSQEEAEQLKQQILNDYEIVNRLRERIKECSVSRYTRWIDASEKYNKKRQEYESELKQELQKILEGKK